MPRKVPKKINYMDMKIPLEYFRIPKSKTEQLKLIKRFETEFGEKYELDPWVDPSYDVDRYTMNPIYEYNSIEEKIERIRRRNMYVLGLRNALARGDKKLAEKYNSLRDTILPDNDNGWNMIPGLKKKKEEYEKGVRK